MYRAIPNPFSGGAGDAGDSEDVEDVFEDLKIDLRNRLVVWYRAIYNRPAEIIAITTLPKTIKKVKADWKKQVEDNDDKFEDATFLIPEYQDLIKITKENRDESLDERIKINRKISSYTIYYAIVERKTINILTLHYGIPKQFFAELFDMKKADEVKDVIHKFLKGNPCY
jgi:hypothetical protein